MSSPWLYPARQYLLIFCSMAATPPACSKCIHYYITHDALMPFGCRAMKFKSANNPAQVVFDSSGMHCQLFSAKKCTKKRAGK
jgi:hypothetical protein